MIPARATMTFPVYLHAFGHAFHPHMVMEVIAYSAGFQLYRALRSRFPQAKVPFEQNLWVFVGAVFGALIGSKLLAWTESMPEYWPHRFDPAAWMGGKTIVGGLLGGWAGVEFAKRRLRIRHSTGDAFVFPLILGQCLGRVGCFLTGLDDHTCGNFSNLPWAVNFGDGPRHPTQLYEIAFLLLLGATLWIAYRSFRAFLPNGTLFRLYLLGYLLFRFFIEFIKPTWKPYLGLSAIQIASVAGAAVCAFQLARSRTIPRASGTFGARGVAADGGRG
jgi:phosphatidylglycerol---prolipoprotein diacylglyceryl transferase